jgi:hypothetical protein
MSLMKLGRLVGHVITETEYADQAQHPFNFKLITNDPSHLKYFTQLDFSSVLSLESYLEEPLTLLQFIRFSLDL